MSDISDLFMKIATTQPKISVDEIDGPKDVEAMILEEPVAPVLRKPQVPVTKTKVMAPVQEAAKEVTSETFDSVSDIMRKIQSETKLVSDERAQASKPVEMQEEVINLLAEKMFGKGGPASTTEKEKKIGIPKPKNKVNTSPSVKEGVVHQVINVRTKELVHTAPTKETAKRHATRKDIEFGRIIHAIRKVKEDEEIKPKNRKPLKHNSTVKPVRALPPLTAVHVPNGTPSEDAEVVTSLAVID